MVGKQVSSFRPELRLDKPTVGSELVRRGLSDAAREAPRNTALLLSGRLDSGALARLQGPEIPVITAGMKGAPDLKYARKLAELVGVKNSNIIQIEWDEDQAMAVLRETVRTMQSYDLAILSDMVVYGCMVKAKELGITTIRTGDPADELFEGEGSRINVELLEDLQSKRIGSRLGLRMDYPYRKKNIIEIAKSLRVEENVRHVDVEVPSDHYAHYEKAGGWDKSRGYDWTKLTLRRAMYGILPNDVVYRMKAPLQYGSWTYKLTNRLNDIAKKGMAKLDDASKTFWNRTDKFGMHVGLYRIYTELNLSPPKITSPQTQYECRGCKGAVDETTQICHTCGIWPTKNGSITNGEGDRND